MRNPKAEKWFKDNLPVILIFISFLVFSVLIYRHEMAVRSDNAQEEIIARTALQVMPSILIAALTALLVYVAAQQTKATHKMSETQATLLRIEQDRTEARFGILHFRGDQVGFCFLVVVNRGGHDSALERVDALLEGRPAVSATKVVRTGPAGATVSDPHDLVVRAGGIAWFEVGFALAPGDHMIGIEASPVISGESGRVAFDHGDGAPGAPAGAVLMRAPRWSHRDHPR